MLSYDLRNLESVAARVDATLPAGDPVWEDGDTTPVDGIRVTGRLSTAGSDRYYFSGRLEGRAQGMCRRCLVPVERPVEEEVHVLFAEAGGEDEDDPDVFPIEGRDRELDLRPAIREQWLLAVPQFVLCRDDCRGLCHGCGMDLNTGACECAPRQDPRWDALRSPDASAR